MRQLRRTRRLLVAVPTVLLLSFAATGCGDLFQDAVEKQVEDAAKEEDVDLDLDDGEFKVDTTDGGVVTGELPEGFPTDEVPVVEGEILTGYYAKNPESWNVTIEVGPAGGDKTASYDEAEATLVDAGLDTTREKVDNGTAISGQYATDAYLVELAVTDSNGIVVNYLVTPK